MEKQDKLYIRSLNYIYMSEQKHEKKKTTHTHRVVNSSEIFYVHPPFTIANTTSSVRARRSKAEANAQNSISRAAANMLN